MNGASDTKLEFTGTKRLLYSNKDIVVSYENEYNVDNDFNPTKTTYSCFVIKLKNRIAFLDEGVEYYDLCKKMFYDIVNGFSRVFGGNGNNVLEEKVITIYNTKTDEYVSVIEKVQHGKKSVEFVSLLFDDKLLKFIENRENIENFEIGKKKLKKYLENYLNK